MLVQPKLLILTTLFDDPPLKIPCNASRDLDGRDICIESTGYVRFNSIQVFFFISDKLTKKDPLKKIELKSFESYVKTMKKIKKNMMDIVKAYTL